MATILALDHDNHRSRQRLYSHSEVEVLNLVSHPIWVFDILNKSMWWGNAAALVFWKAQTLEDLTGRNFADDMSETVQKKNIDTLERLKRNERWDEVVRRYVQASCCRAAFIVSSCQKSKDKRTHHHFVCFFVPSTSLFLNRI
jgi:ferric iron reductase protein FhuF